jgi:hypothetical protein
VQTENEKAVRAFNEWFDTAAVSSDGDDLLCRESAQRAWQAALQSQVSNTDGWIMVPVTPTREMWDAVNKLDDEMAAGGYDGKGCSIEQAWDCLIAAAPKAPQQVSNTPQDGVAIDHTNMDAAHWAGEFCKAFPGHDESLMLSWFANAIMCGWDNAHWKMQKESTPPQQQEQSGEAVAFAKGRLEGLAIATKICDDRIYALDGGGNSYRRPADAEQCANAIRKEYAALYREIYPIGDTPTATASQESTPTSDQVVAQEPS